MSRRFAGVFLASIGSPAFVATFFIVDAGSFPLVDRGGVLYFLYCFIFVCFIVIFIVIIIDVIDVINAIANI